ncbi:hypothetical protein [Niabella hirudinis]|uniref:hypothetical protein n=1 Tax=Niabella hirudinis TaxID=1285929 RepID=UPI003EB99B59
METGDTAAASATWGATAKAVIVPEKTTTEILEDTRKHKEKAALSASPMFVYFPQRRKGARTQRFSRQTTAAFLCFSRFVVSQPFATKAPRH